MFFKSVVVEDCVSSHSRHLAGNLAGALSDALRWWLAQEPESPRELRMEAQLQQLNGISPAAAQEFCTEVEGAIVNASELIMVQLGQTAYNTLRAIGYDCASFEWVMEV